MSATSTSLAPSASSASKKKPRLGIMGGTFDPIHIGHLIIAEAARDEYGLERVVFIPAGFPPHKQGMRVTSAMHRYIMTLLATSSNPYFWVSSIELERSGPSYSIDTVKALHSQYGEERDLYFITGTDAVLDLPNWRDIDQLLDLCWFVAATRPGCLATIDETINYFGGKGRDKILRLATPELEISSTDIRERVRLGKSLKYIVPEAVENYILKEGLYRQN